MFDELKPFLPEGTVSTIAKLLEAESYHLIICNPRKTKLGDFRPAHNGKPPRITVNGDLNPYNFLITLVHEIAHLKVWNVHQNKVPPHGREWKNEYSKLLQLFTGRQLFPAEVETAIQNHLSNPKYSSCVDPNLTKTLRKYDEGKSTILLQDMQPGRPFAFSNRAFKVEKKLRTRYLCEEINTGLKYRIHGLAEVHPLEENWATFARKSQG